MVRRSFAQGMTMANDQQVTGTAAPVRMDYTVMKGKVSLAVYRKRFPPAASETPRPVLFLVHGSSNSGLSSFDLTVPDAGEYSPASVTTSGRWTMRITAAHRAPKAIPTSRAASPI
jgi:hypothetical protein